MLQTKTASVVPSISLYDSRGRVSTFLSLHNLALSQSAIDIFDMAESEAVFTTPAEAAAVVAGLERNLNTYVSLQAERD